MKNSKEDKVVRVHAVKAYRGNEGSYTLHRLKLFLPKYW
jgi:hypothetical protein